MPLSRSRGKLRNLKKAIVSTRQLAKSLPEPFHKGIRWMLKGYYHTRLRAGLPDNSPPWSVGYSVYKRHLLVQTLTDQYLLERFYAGDPLPTGYGTGIDERCVEYPWVLAQLRSSGCLLLDAGSALNHDILID